MIRAIITNGIKRKTNARRETRISNVLFIKE